MTSQRLSHLPLFTALAITLGLTFSSPKVSLAKSDPVAKAFKGKILLSAEPLPEPGTASVKETISVYRKSALKTLTGKTSNGVATFDFHLMAFLKTKPKSSSLALEFYTDDKEKLFVADKRLNGVDTSTKILTTHITISEDENLNRGRRYVVKLVANTGKKTQVLAEAKITTSK